MITVECGITNQEEIQSISYIFESVGNVSLLRLQTYVLLLFPVVLVSKNKKRKKIKKKKQGRKNLQHLINCPLLPLASQRPDEMAG